MLPTLWRLEISEHEDTKPKACYHLSDIAVIKLSLVNASYH